MHEGRLKHVVDKEFPDFTKLIEKETDPKLIASLFRDYTFLISMYTLEPCHINLKQNGEYGVGRSVVPKNLGRPAVILANKLRYKHPWLEYAHAYALNNWTLLKKGGDDWNQIENIRMFRQFHGCLNES